MTAEKFKIDKGIPIPAGGGGAGNGRYKELRAVLEKMALN